MYIYIFYKIILNISWNIFKTVQIIDLLFINNLDHKCKIKLDYKYKILYNKFNS